MGDRSLQAIQDTVRLPFYGTENIHNDLSDNIIQDQYIQNLIPQFAVDQTTETKEGMLVKRPGLQLITSSDFMTGIVNDKTQCTIMDAIPITALFDVFVIAVFDDSNDTFYIIMARPEAGTFTKMGSFAPTGTKDDYCFLTEYTQSSAGSLFPAVAVSWTNKTWTASKGYYAISGSGVFAAASLTEITSTGFPPKQTPALISIGRFVWMKGVMYIASIDGRIWNSTTNGNDITTWSNGVISVSSYPDQLMGLERYKHHVIAFGRNSIEFFNDVGDTPCPLTATEQAFIKFGAKSPRLVKNVNDVIYWVAYGNDGNAGLWQLDGYTPVKLSTANIDQQLMSLNAVGDPAAFNMQATQMLGKTMIIINQAQGGSVPPLPAWYAGTSPTGTDTYPLDLLNDFTSATPVYNIVDKTWWFLQIRSNGGIGLICAGTEFNTPATGSKVNYYSNIVLYNIDGTHSQNYMYQWGNTLNVNRDEVGNSSDTDYPHRPITTYAQMNINWFGNEKRKRVNKAKIIGYIPKNNTDSNVYSMYLWYLKDQEALSGTATLDKLMYRQLNFPNSFYRYYWNNLGMGRAWTFGVAEKSKQPVTYKALELDIQQGSH